VKLSYDSSLIHRVWQSKPLSSIFLEPGAEKEKITKLVKSEESKAAKKTSVPK